MAKTGEKLINKTTGEEITWIETSSMTKGQHLKLKLEVAPKGHAPVAHIHPNQDEDFEIIKGKLKLWIKGKTQFLEAGQSIAVKKGVPHNWWNESDSVPIDMNLTFTPALKMETFFEQYFGLSNDLERNPSFIQMMAMSPEYDIYKASPPVILQKILATILGPIAMLMGYKKFYEKYSQP